MESNRPAVETGHPKQRRYQTISGQGLTLKKKKKTHISKINLILKTNTSYGFTPQPDSLPVVYLPTYFYLTSFVNYSELLEHLK